MTGTEDEPKIDPANTIACYKKMAESEDYGESQLDKELAQGVEIKLLPPDQTGFHAWKRRDDYVESGEERDRGYADYAVPTGAGNTAPRILYCHGGGYEYYSPQTPYRPTTTRLAAATGMPVLAFDYRLTPEFKHPAQLDDAVQAFEWLVMNGPDGPGRASHVFLAGDSAGGGLALALAIRLRDMGGVQPAGVSVVSPQADMTCSGASYTTRRWKEGGGPKCDPIFRGEDPGLDSMDQIYQLLGKPGEAGSFPLAEPSISPVHAELHNLPPTQIHVGDSEVMLSEAEFFGEKARAAGSNVQVVVWPYMWHVFVQYTEGCGGENAKPLAEALLALKQQASFMKSLASAPGGRSYQFLKLPMLGISLLGLTLLVVPLAQHLWSGRALFPKLRRSLASWWRFVPGMGTAAGMRDGGD